MFLQNHTVCVCERVESVQNEGVSSLLSPNGCELSQPPLHPLSYLSMVYSSLLLVLFFDYIYTGRAVKKRPQGPKRSKFSKISDVMI